MTYSYNDSITTSYVLDDPFLFLCNNRIIYAYNANRDISISTLMLAYSSFHYLLIILLHALSLYPKSYTFHIQALLYLQLFTFTL